VLRSVWNDERWSHHFHIQPKQNWPGLRPAILVIDETAFDGRSPGAYSGAAAMATTSALGPVFGAGFAQRMVPRRLSAAVAALDKVIDSFS
jgi:hypothetical protein